MLHKTPCGRRAAATFARELDSLVKQGRGVGQRAQALRSALREIIQTHENPGGYGLGPWYCLPGKKTKPAVSLAYAVRMWARVEI